jgi:hypothetical protein
VSKSARKLPRYGILRRGRCDLAQLTISTHFLRKARSFEIRNQISPALILNHAYGAGFEALRRTSLYLILTTFPTGQVFGIDSEAECSLPWVRIDIPALENRWTLAKRGGYFENRRQWGIIHGVLSSRFHDCVRCLDSCS